MRTKKALLSSAVMMAAGLLGGPIVMASDSSGTNIPTPAPSPPPTSCSTGLFEMAVSSGPSPVDCSAPGGLCTEIEYEVVSGGTPDHVAVLEGIGVWSVDGPGNQWYQPCKGDEVTDLGERSCHEQAVKVNPSDSVKKFKVVLAGQRKSGPTSIATKKGNKKGSCRILGIGLDAAAGAGPLDIVTTSKTQTFGDCIVTVKTPATGDVVVEIAEGSPEECYLLDPDGTELQDVELTVPGHEGPLTGLQAEAFSFVTSGSRCWSQVVPTPNGKLYTVCR
jgi:hypothetical protein